MRISIASLKVSGYGGIPRLRRRAVVLGCVMLLFLTSGFAEVFFVPSEAAQAETPREVPAPATPTPDPERVRLEKNKLMLENQKLELEKEKLAIENENSREARQSWLSRFLVNLPFLTTVILGAWGLFRYLEGRRAELRNRYEERFERVVKSLGSEQAEERVSSSFQLP